MDDDQPAPSSRGPVAVGRSLEAFGSPDVVMESIVEKLKLLDYEKDFCRRKKPYRLPLAPAYFAVPAPQNQQGEQFYYFGSLAAWLLTQAGIDFPAPKEFDDPQKLCQDLVSAARQLGFGAPSYHPSKLTLGCGKEVCGLLDGLIDYVLEKQGFQYKRPVYQPDGYNEELEDDEDADAAMEGADEFVGVEQADDEEEEAYMDVGSVGPAPSAAAADGPTDKSVLVSKVDPTLWKMELERVTPKLRITLAADAKDWRSHLDEAHEHQKTIDTAWPDSRGALERLRGDLNTALEKLQTREQFLNEQFENLMEQYKASRQQLQLAQDDYNKRSESVSDRNSELHRINEQLEEIKQNMDERGSNIADATPVVRIKNAIKKLNEELKDMEVRIGIVSHTLLQLSLKNKRLMQAQAAALSDEDDDL